MRTNKITLIRKLQIVQEANHTQNVKKTARKFKVQPCQLRQWRANYAKIKEMVEKNPKKLTVHAGRSLDSIELENTVYEWIMDQTDA